MRAISASSSDRLEVSDLGADLFQLSLLAFPRSTESQSPQTLLIDMFRTMAWYH